MTLTNTARNKVFDAALEWYKARLRGENPEVMDTANKLQGAIESYIDNLLVDDNIKYEDR